MIEIKKVIKLKKGELVISRQNNKMHIEYKGCTKNNATNNAVINALVPIVQSQYSYNNKIKFVSCMEAMNDINYLFSVKDTIISLKEDCCHKTYSKSPLVEKIEAQVQSIDSFLHSGISSSSLSYAEKLVLGEINKVGFDSIDLHKLSYYYDTLKFSLSPNLDKLVNEVNSFDYKRYGKTSKITESFNDNVKGFKANIASYEKLVKEHGEDLVNWGDHMLTRRGVNEYQVRSWVKEYANYLIKKKGVAPKEKNTNNSVKKSRDNPDKTQEDYFRLFKSGDKDESRNVVHNLSLDNLKVLMTNPIKSVADRIRENKERIINRFCDLDDGTGFNLVFSFTKSNHGNTLPVKYLFKVVDSKAKYSKENIVYCLKNCRELMEEEVEEEVEYNEDPLDEAIEEEVA